MKTKSKIYPFLLTLVILCCAFFFSTKAWLPDDRTVQKQNYDTLFSVGDWSIHVGAARCARGAQSMDCVVYQRSDIDSPKAYVVKAYLGDPALNQPLPCSLKTRMNDPDLADLVIDKIPRDYYYVTLVFTAMQTDTDTAYTASSSAYGTQGYDSTPSTTTQKAEKVRVQIDYRAALKNANIATSNSAGKAG